MNEQHIIKKRSSKAGLYTLLILILFIVLGLVGFTAFVYIQTNNQFNQLEARLVKGDEAYEDINLKLSDISKNVVVDNENTNTNISTKSALDTELSEVKLPTTTSQTNTAEGNMKFNNSHFPFTFSYDSTWTLSTPDSIQKINGTEILSLDENEISLLSPDDQVYVEEAMSLEGADYEPSTVHITFYKDSSILSAVSKRYENESSAERVEVLSIGDYQVEVYQDNSGISQKDDYFVLLGSDVVVVSVSTSRFAEQIIETLR